MARSNGSAVCAHAETFEEAMAVAEDAAEERGEASQPHTEEDSTPHMK